MGDLGVLQGWHPDAHISVTASLHLGHRSNTGCHSCLSSLLVPSFLGMGQPPDKHRKPTWAGAVAGGHLPFIRPFRDTLSKMFL